jgi:hypothetical protein
VLLVEDDDGDARLVEDEPAESLPGALVLRSGTLKDALSLPGQRIARRRDRRERPPAPLDDLIAEVEHLNGEALSNDVAMLLVGLGGDAGES